MHLSNKNHWRNRSENGCGLRSTVLPLELQTLDASAAFAPVPDLGAGELGLALAPRNGKKHRLPPPLFFFNTYNLYLLYTSSSKSKYTTSMSSFTFFLQIFPFLGDTPDRPPDTLSQATLSLLDLGLCRRQRTRQKRRPRDLFTQTKKQNSFF